MQSASHRGFVARFEQLHESSVEVAAHQAEQAFELARSQSELDAKQTARLVEQRSARGRDTTVNASAAGLKQRRHRIHRHALHVMEAQQATLLAAQRDER